MNLASASRELCLDNPIYLALPKFPSAKSIFIINEMHEKMSEFLTASTPESKVSVPPVRSFRTEERIPNESTEAVNAGYNSGNNKYSEPTFGSVIRHVNPLDHDAIHRENRTSP